MKLGFTEDQANFNMHCEAEEWECLGPSTSNMLKKNFVGAEEESEDCDPDKKEDNNDTQGSAAFRLLNLTVTVNFIFLIMTFVQLSSF